MKCLDKFNKRMLRSGNNLREENIIAGRNAVAYSFADDPSYRTGIYFWKNNISDYSDEKQIEIRLYKERFSDANGNLIKFQTMFDTPVVFGDILFDSELNRYWICTESNNIGGINWQGKLTMCNWFLKWQDENGVIWNYPCQDMNATQYNSGERGNKQFTIGSAQHIVTTVCDDNTIKIRTPRRFYLDKSLINPVTYVVTQNDTTSYNYDKGLCKITLYQYVDRPKNDRPDLGICDYVENNTSIPSSIIPNVSNKPLIKIISSKTVIKSGGSKQTYTVELFDESGNTYNGNISWEVVCDFVERMEIRKDGNTITIKVDDDNLIDERFKLVATDTDRNISDSVVITIDSLL